MSIIGDHLTEDNSGMYSSDSTYETIELNLTDEEFLVLAKLAHERDITFNQLVNDILRDIISDLKSKE